MTPVKIDSNTSSAATDANVGLKFTPSQSTTVNELFNGFLQRAADTANSAAADGSASSPAPASSPDSGASSSGAANSNASSNGASAPTKNPNAASTNNRGNLPPTLLPLGARNAKQAANAQSTLPNGVLTGGKTTSSSSKATPSHSHSDAAAPSAQSAGDAKDGVTPSATPGQAPVVDDPVVTPPNAVAAQVTEAGTATRGKSLSSKPTATATKSLAPADGARPSGSQNSTDLNANAALGAKSPPVATTATGATTASAITAAQRTSAAAGQSASRGQKGTAGGLVTQAGHAAASAATGKQGVASTDHLEQSGSSSVAENTTAELPTTEPAPLPATSDLSTTDGQAAGAVETALATVAATTAIVTPVVEKSASVASSAGAATLATGAATSGAATTLPTAAASDAGANSAASDAAATSRTATTAAGSSSANKTNAGGADNSGGVDRVRFVQRVAKAFQTLGDQGGTLRLRLSPPELGTVQLNVSVRKGTMSAQVETDTSDARDLIMNNLPALRQRLNELNIQVENFDVNVAGQSSGGASGQSSQENAYSQTGGRSSNTLGRSNNNDSGPIAAPASSRASLGSSSLLNVVV